jgi:hypothetical protein
MNEAHNPSAIRRHRFARKRLPLVAQVEGLTLAKTIGNIAAFRQCSKERVNSIINN